MQQINKKDDDAPAPPPGSPIVFDNKPIYYECPYCTSKGITYVSFQPTIVTGLVIILTLVLFNIFVVMFLSPFIYFLTKAAVHKCKNCSNQVGKDKRILSVFNFDDEILTFSIGQSAVICTRKIIFIGFLVCLIVLIGFWKISNIDLEQGILIDASWTDFKSECGREIYLLQERTQYQRCELKYLERMVSGWSGYVIQVHDYRDSYERFLSHAVTILVKLEPTESEILPDLVLAISSSHTDKFTNELAKLERGMEFGFNATFKGLGNEMSIRHAHLNGLWLKSGYKELPEHIHYGGRYSSQNTGSQQCDQICVNNAFLLNFKAMPNSYLNCVVQKKQKQSEIFTQNNYNICRLYRIIIREA